MKEKYTLVLDSTQIQAFLECPEFWNLAHNENLVKNDAWVEAMNMGSYGHLILENYYKDIARGIPQMDAFEHAESIECPQSLKLEPEKIQLIREKLRLYSYTYSKNDFVPLSPDTVELGFSHKLYEDDNRLYILEGKMDYYSHAPSVGMYQGARSFLDHKFQLRAKDLYGKRIQFKNYALATDARVGVINYIRFTKKTDDTTFQRKLITFSSIDLELWKKRLIKIYRDIETSNKMASGELTGKPEPRYHNWGNCETRYGYQCPYTDICESVTTAEVEMNKATKYHKIEKWSPWTIQNGKV